LIKKLAVEIPNEHTSASGKKRKSIIFIFKPARCSKRIKNTRTRFLIRLV
jgi:hypothetical protein